MTEPARYQVMPWHGAVTSIWYVVDGQAVCNTPPLVLQGYDSAEAARQAAEQLNHPVPVLAVQVPVQAPGLSAYERARREQKAEGR